MAQRVHGDFELNFRRGVAFLELAVEQLRNFDKGDQRASTALALPLHEMRQVFEKAALDMKKEQSVSVVADSYDTALATAGDELFNNIVTSMRLAPPGQGKGHFPEAAPKLFPSSGDMEQSNSTRAEADMLQRFASLSVPDWPARRLSSQEDWSPAARAFTSTTPSSKTTPTVGVIGDRRAAHVSTRSSGRLQSTDAVRSLVDRSGAANLARHWPPLFDTNRPNSGRANFFETLENITARAQSRSQSRGRMSDVEESPRRLSTNEESSGTVSERFRTESGNTSLDSTLVVNVTNVDGSRGRSSTTRGASTQADEPKTEEAPQQTKPAHTPKASWAKIAAITPTSSWNKPEQFEGAATTALTSAQSRLNPVPAHVTLSRNESEAERLRVVWISNIPTTFTLRDVSEGITVGPVCSILKYQRAVGHLTPQVACVIFQLASTAEAFLVLSRTPHQHIYPNGKNVRFELGEAYGVDAGLAAMEGPHFARRRLKWSRGRLFYDVTHEQFKSDIYALVGVPAYVELVHFYNPGECTVVFASVQVAQVVFEHFVQLKALKQSKYFGVDVAYVHDFNECPAVLYTQYAANGTLYGGRFTGVYSGKKVPEEKTKEEDEG